VRTGDKLRRAARRARILSEENTRTIRRDGATGQFVDTCDKAQSVEKFSAEGGISGSLTFQCDGTGEGAKVKIVSLTAPEIRAGLRANRDDPQTRESIERYRKELTKALEVELQREFDQDRLERVTRDDEGQTKGVVIGVEDFDYAALDLGNIKERRDAQGLARAINRYAGGAFKFSSVKKKFKASGRGAMPFNDAVVNRFFDADELKFLAGASGEAGADRAVVALERK
jgi:hypothetical protein